MSKDYWYTVDGEKVTLDEICAKYPKIARATMSNRVRLGWRTWAELGKPAQANAEANRRAVSKRMAEQLGRVGR